MGALWYKIMTFQITSHAVRRAWSRIPQYDEYTFEDVCCALQEKLEEAHDMGLFFHNPAKDHSDQYVAYFQVGDSEVIAIISAHEPCVVSVWIASYTVFRPTRGDVDYTAIMVQGQAAYACVENLASPLTQHYQVAA